MVVLHRIKASKLKFLSNQFKRSYFRVPAPSLANHSALGERIWVFDKPSLVVHKSQFEFANSVRFFAAPVQAKPKQEEKDSSGPRLNEQIKAEFVRLVSDEGHNVVSRREALERARSLKLDLVEVQRNANPPVCKLMDYHREKYKQQLKDKDRAKSKSEVTLRKGDCKEVRFSGKTEQKDLQMKADTVKRLMERGYRVKCMAMGTEEQDLGGLLSRLAALIEDVSVVESGPRVERKQAYVIVRHVKFGPSKKGGSGKNAFKVPEVQKVATSPPIGNNLNPSPIHSEDFVGSAESKFETVDGSLSDEADTPLAPSLNLVHSRPGVDSNRRIPSAPSEAPLGIENRYRREPRNAYLPSRSMDGRGTGPMDSRTSFPQYPNQRRQPQCGLNASPSSSTRETEHVDSDSSLYGNLKFPANDNPKQEQVPRSPGSSAPNYGIFSANKVKDTSETKGLPGEINRYKTGNTFNSARHPRPPGA